MERTNTAEGKGFAPAVHTCAYHIWKPKGVSWGCTCSPPPAHQVKWEKTVFDCGEGGVLCQTPFRLGAARGRGLLSRVDRKHMAIFCRASGETLASALRTARKGIAGRFLRVCEVVKSRQSCETELQKGGGP